MENIIEILPKNDFISNLFLVSILSEVIGFTSFRIKSNYNILYVRSFRESGLPITIAEMLIESQKK